MTDIKELLSPLKIPVCETTRDEDVKAPYIVFNESSTSRGADNINLLKERSITLELYTRNKDNHIEESIEKIFNKKGIEIKKGVNTWIEKDTFMLTPFYFDLVERIEYSE